MHTLWQDVRYAVRMLLKNPGFSAIAVVTLALGIGANTALFSVVNGVLLNPLPFPEPQRLYLVFSRTPQSDRWSISYPNFLDWQRENRSFSAIAAFRQDDFNLTGVGEPQRLTADMVSASFFPIFGVKPALGRLFSEQEDQLGAAPVVVISQSFWQRQFAAAADVLGKPLTLNAKVYTIIGVLPSFRFQEWNFRSDADIFVPVGQWDEKLFRDRSVGMGMDAVGRLRPGVTLKQAQQDMSAVSAHLAEVYPDVDKNRDISLVPLKQFIVGDIQPFLLVLLAAVGFVLLIACANVANLLLARSTGRTREFAVRTAIGANRMRMVRQLLTESVLLALAGGTIGLVLAAWGTRAAIKVLPDALPRAEQIQLDGRVLFFTLAASCLAGILFGMIPALKISGIDIHETLKEGGRGGSGTRHRTQSLIVAVEMALALVLLSGAGLMIRSLGNLWNVNPGFDPSNVFFFAFSSSQPLGDSPAAIRASFRKLHEAIAATPGVQAASLKIGSSPMYGDSSLPLWLDQEAKPASQQEMKNALFYVTEPDYLKVMRIPLIRGRFLEESDNENSPSVIVIDEQFASKYFPNTNPIGRHVNFDVINVKAEIVGVVGHVKQWGLDETRTSVTGTYTQCYFPLFQTPDGLFSMMSHGIQGVVRTEPALAGDASFLGRAANLVNSQIVVYGTRTMNDIIANSLSAKRFVMILLGIFAALATVLSSVGIYGVISYIVGQRTHEIGVRMALGARRRDVWRLMLSPAGRMALIGVGVGLLAALGLTQLMASMLFGISAHDPLTLLGVALFLSLVALAACVVPARRATRVDPMVALRYE